jgi:AraC-like DNA-binding protein
LEHDFAKCGRDRLRARELLVGLLGRLFEHHRAGSSLPRVVPQDRALFAQVDATMRAQYAADLSLAYLAQTVGITSFQLIGLCKRVSGLTPHAYLTQIRVSVARDRLKQGCPIAVAAAESGFYDQSALTRYFKRGFGITPGQFAAAHGGPRNQRRQ